MKHFPQKHRNRRRAPGRRRGFVEALEGRRLLATVVPFDVTFYDPDPVVMDANLGTSGYTIESFEDAELTPGLSMFFIGEDFNYERGPFGPVTVLPDPMRDDLFDAWDGTTYMNNRTPEGNRYRTIFQLPDNAVSFGVGLGLISRLTSDFRVWTNGQVVVESVKALPQYVNDSATERNIYLRIDADPDEILENIEVQQSAGIQMLTDNLSFDHVAILTMPTVSLGVDNDTIDEADGVATFTARLSHPFDRAVTVDLGLAGTAGVEDYTVSGSQIVIPAGAVDGAVTVDAIDDAIDEVGETVVLEITGVTNGTEDGIQQQTTTIVDNDDPPTVTLAVDNANIPESGGVATVTATLSTLSSQPVIVDLEITGTAAASDYSVSNTRIIIAPGVESGDVTISTIADQTDEPDEDVLVGIAAVANGTEDGTQQIVTTILDDDPAPAVTLAVDRENIVEDGGVASVIVTLAAVSGHPVTVDLLFGGTADEADFTASGTQIEIAPGVTSGSLTIAATDDELDELHETVIVEIDRVVNAVESEPQQQSITILDDDDPPALQVSALTAVPSGFIAEFSTQLDAAELNLYDTQTAALGPADISLIGAATGEVPGSLVLDPLQRRVTFVKSGGPLDPDTYTVTIQSGESGFKSDRGQLLDGNGDGTGGDTFQSTFTVAPPTASTISIGVPDLVRGPGQEINLPADSISGVPLSISEGTNVRAIDLRIRFDPAMLEISDAVVAADMPPSATVVINNTTPGVLILSLFSATSLPAGPVTFAHLRATVPADAAVDIYRMQQILDVHDVTISDGDDNEFPVVVDDALHVATFFADVSGNGRVNAADAAQVARNAALLDSGFRSNLLTDPRLLGDISGNGRLNAADASLVAQFAALLAVPQIPPIPAGVVVAGTAPTASSAFVAGRTLLPLVVPNAQKSVNPGYSVARWDPPREATADVDVRAIVDLIMSGAGAQGYDDGGSSSDIFFDLDLLGRMELDKQGLSGILKSH